MANAAAKAEAKSSATPLSVEHRGQTFELVPTDEWGMDVLEAVEDGKLTGILRGILKGDGYARLKALSPKITELTEFADNAMKALGVSGK